MVETPKAFLKWSLLSAVSAVVSPNLILNKQGAYDLYPNIFVMLLSDSGIGKGFGVWLAKSLVAEVDSTRVFSGRNSIQKIVTDLSIAYSRKGKEMIKDGRAFLASGEFVNFLLKDDQAISILTEWYDTHWVKDWPNSLKSSGTERIKDVNITMLGGSTPDYLRQAVPSASIKGGFFARLMFIWAGEKGRVDALIEDAEEGRRVSPEKIKELSKYLKELAKLKGEFKPSNKAREMYRPWYYDVQNRIKSRQLVDNTGYVNRLHDHVLKVAMILALIEDTELIIRSHHVEEAIEMCQDLMITAKKATLGIGLSSFAPKNEAFLRTLFTANGNEISRRILLQRNHNEFDSGDLDRMALTFEDAGLVKTKREGREVYYMLTTAGRKEFLELQRRIQ
jgi:DNA-binding MarR family transcriptional regulator